MNVPFGERSKRADFAFVWIFARNCNPYEGYELNDIPVVNLVLAQMRWDGMLGASGGMVEDSDNTLEEAAAREVYEELGYTIDISQLKPMKTIRLLSGSHVHSYSYEVSYDELKKIRDNASTGQHFSAECAGVNLMHISRYDKGHGNEVGYNVIKSQNWVGTSLEELEYLVEKENLLISYLP